VIGQCDQREHVEHAADHDAQDQDQHADYAKGAGDAAERKQYAAKLRWPSARRSPLSDSMGANARGGPSTACRAARLQAG
jgi:hypothetical protein